MVALTKPATARKTQRAWRFFVNYGQGWEHETTEHTWDAMAEQRKAYRENCPYPLRIKFISRESIEHGCPCCRAK